MKSAFSVLRFSVLFHVNVAIIQWGECDKFDLLISFLIYVPSACLQGTGTSGGKQLWHFPPALFCVSAMSSCLSEDLLKLQWNEALDVLCLESVMCGVSRSLWCFSHLSLWFFSHLLGTAQQSTRGIRARVGNSAGSAREAHRGCCRGSGGSTLTHTGGAWEREPAGDFPAGREAGLQ